MSWPQRAKAPSPFLRPPGGITLKYLEKSRGAIGKTLSWKWGVKKKKNQSDNMLKAGH